MKPCETHTPAVLNTTFEGKDAYNTNDLLLPHPTKPGCYKVHGRVDDQIMLSTGEKVSSFKSYLYLADGSQNLKDKSGSPWYAGVQGMMHRATTHLEPQRRSLAKIL